MENDPPDSHYTPLASNTTLAIPEEEIVIDTWGSISVIDIITAWGMGRLGAPM